MHQCNPGMYLEGVRGRQESTSGGVRGRQESIDAPCDSPGGYANGLDLDFKHTITEPVTILDHLGRPIERSRWVWGFNRKAAKSG